MGENSHVDSNAFSHIHDVNSDYSPLPISTFQTMLPELSACKKLSKNVKRYYKKQHEIINSFEDVHKVVCQMPRDMILETIPSRRGSILSVLDVLVKRKSDCSTSAEHVNPNMREEKQNPLFRYLRSRKGQTFLAKMALFATAVLVVVKIAAVALSMSLSVISSLLDSCVDMLSGSVLWWAAYSMHRSDVRRYPHGRTRLEPIAIIILAVFMSMASFQIIREGIDRIIAMATENVGPPDMTNSAIIISAFTVVVKIGMHVVCRVFGESLSVRALAIDSRNDVFSYSAALLFSTLSSRLNVENLKYLDPIGAILVALYIIVCWVRAGKEHVKSLTGYIGSPEIHQKVSYLVLCHHPAILQVDTVQVVQLGPNYLTEVHIVLPPHMHLAEAHNIGEALQRKLECLPEIERAFVHIDYESRHRYAFEHKVVIA